jgi:hypothetical protein
MHADTKTCTKCGETKPLTAFGKSKPAKDGRHTQCGPCRAAWMKAKRAAQDPAERRAKAREQMAAWRLANPDRNKELWTQNNARVNALRAEDPERFRAYQRQRWANYSPEQRARYREWRQNRRALLLAAFVEDVQLADVLIRDSGICGICGAPIMEDTIEMDHIVPISRGGLHERANVQVAHQWCNRSKYNREVASPRPMAASG